MNIKEKLQNLVWEVASAERFGMRPFEAVEVFFFDFFGCEFCTEDCTHQGHDYENGGWKCFRIRTSDCENYDENGDDNVVGWGEYVEHYVDGSTSVLFDFWINDDELRIVLTRDKGEEDWYLEFVKFNGEKDEELFKEFKENEESLISGLLDY